MTTDEKHLTVRCPKCGRRGLWLAGSFGPFCSERCKLIDLGAWAAEEHAIAGDLVDDELFSTDLSPLRH